MIFSLDIFVAYIQDPVAQAIFLLTFADLFFGVLLAIRQKEYQSAFVGQWYDTNIIRYIGGYFIVFAMTRISQSNFAHCNLESEHGNFVIMRKLYSCSSIVTGATDG